MNQLWNWLSLWRNNRNRRRTIAPLARKNQPQLEELESRTLMSTTVTLAAGVLKIQADPSSFNNVAVNNYNPIPTNPCANLLLVSVGEAFGPMIPGQSTLSRNAR